MAWLNEKLRLADSYLPKITAKLSLTGPPTLSDPESKVISSEEITISGTAPPYPLDFTREFSLVDLPLGTYTLTFTNAVKTGGSWINQYNTTVHLKDHALTFPVGD